MSSSAVSAPAVRARCVVSPAKASKSLASPMIRPSRTTVRVRRSRVASNFIYVADQIKIQDREAPRRGNLRADADAEVRARRSPQDDQEIPRRARQIGR